MKKSINFLVALVLGAGTAAIAPAHAESFAAQSTVQYACVKNGGRQAIQAQFKVNGKTSRKSRPTKAGRTACFRLPKGTTFKDSITAYAYMNWTPQRGYEIHQRPIIFHNYPYRVSYNYVSTGVYTDPRARDDLSIMWRHTRMYMPPDNGLHNNCDQCDYYDF